MKFYRVEPFWIFKVSKTLLMPSGNQYFFLRSTFLYMKIYSCCHIHQIKNSIKPSFLEFMIHFICSRPYHEPLFLVGLSSMKAFWANSVSVLHCTACMKR